MGGLPKRAGLFFCSLPWCYCRGSRRKRCCPSGPSASLHPPTPYGAVPPAYGRGWPGSFRTTPLATMHIHYFLHTTPSPRLHVPPPAYGRGWPGPFRTTPLTTMHLRVDLPTPDGAVPPAYGRGWPGSFRTTPLTTMHWGFISSSLTARRPLSGTGYPWACPDGLRC